MIITREQIINIGNIIINVKQKSSDCSITLKYKILKLEQLLKEEFTLSSILLKELSLKYAELTDDNKLNLTEDGGVKIQKDKIVLLEKELKDFYNQTITIPDFFFTLDELDTLSLTWDELESFIPFIK